MANTLIEVLYEFFIVGVWSDCELSRSRFPFFQNGWPVALIDQRHLFLREQASLLKTNYLESFVMSQSQSVHFSIDWKLEVMLHLR
jgi:hypothetical protein